MLFEDPRERRSSGFAHDNRHAANAGTCAQIVERWGDLDPMMIQNILQASARDLGARGRDVEFGAGLVDAYAAIVAPENIAGATAVTPTRASTR